MAQKHVLARQDGFTLMEMVIVMAIFIVVIMITSNSFNTALTRTKKVTKTEESNIEGVIGLEMLRHDLAQAGLGLFTEVDPATALTYTEATETRAATYNDSPSGIPRAVLAGNNITGDAGVLDGTDYLVLKATTLAQSQASQKWTYIVGLGSSKVWGANDFDSSKDFVVANQQTYRSGELHRRLLYTTTAIATKYAASYAAPFGPISNDSQIYYYGLSENSAATLPLTPFNRVDYVVKRTSATPANCAPGAGVLYKRSMSQLDGSMTDVPVLDCVADMQVVLGWNTSNPAGTSLDLSTDADMTTAATPQGWTPTLTDPTDIRKHLKLVKVYLLAQDGGKDLKFTNTDTAFPVGIAGEANSLAHTVNLTGSNYQNYRWKLYRVIVQPKNLM
jgi:prepilin-type N-terminal cleavage/methylation domain-containing protein